jgi:hypothetical protein
MDTETDREIRHIWDRLREHSITIQGVNVLQVQMADLKRAVEKQGENRKWVYVQTVSTLGVLIALVTLLIQR